MCCVCVVCCVLFFQAEDGIRYLVRSRGLGDVYKRQRHRQGGPALHQVEKRLLDEALRLRVEGGGGFVEDQDRRGLGYLSLLHLCHLRGAI